MLDLLTELFPRSCLLCKQRCTRLICQKCLSHHLQSLPQTPYTDPREDFSSAHPEQLATHAEHEHVCSRCGEEAPCYLCLFSPLTSGEVRSRWSFTGEMRHLIHLWKYHDKFQLTSFFAEELLKSMRALSQQKVLDYWNLIVPVPSCRKDILQRGFSQTSLLARRLSRRSGVPYCALLEKFGERSAHSHPEAREDPRISLRKNQELHQARILLLDDVLTTGSTIRSCSRTLEKAGAQRVDALTLARSRHLKKYRLSRYLSEHRMLLQEKSHP